jgi:carboxymethylenebutenolidase
LEEKMDRKAFISALDDSHSELIATLGQYAPLATWDEHRLLNGWTVKDLMGHFLFWEERALWICEMLHANPGATWQEEGLTLNELNARAYEQNRARGAQELLDAEQTAFARLRRIATDYAEADLFDPQRFAWTGGRPLVGIIADNTSGHFEEHWPGLREALGLPGWTSMPVKNGQVRVFTALPRRPGPGIIVLHAWWGLNPFFEQTCRRLAEQGYAVFAPDLNEGKIAHTVDEAKALMQARDFGAMQAVVGAIVPWVRAQAMVRPGPLGVVGFSMGAAWSLVLSMIQPAEVSAVTLFYGTEQIDFTKAQAAFLGHFAAQDEWEPEEGVVGMEAAMKAAGREVTLHHYDGTGHWFFEEDRPDAYQPEAARQAWERTLKFFAEKLRP